MKSAIHQWTEVWSGRDAVRELAKLSPLRSMAAIALEWALLTGAIALHRQFPHPVVYAFAFVLIGTRMYALYSLMHDGMHYLLLKNKFFNDLCTRLFLAWPLFLSLSRTREAHLRHHLHLKTADDPEMAHLQYDEFKFPKTRRQWLAIWMMDLTGINFLRYFIAKKIRAARKVLSGRSVPGIMPKPVSYHQALKLVYYTVLAAVLMWTNTFMAFVLYWLLPYMTLYQLLNRIRLSTEHFHIASEEVYQTRTVKSGWIERALIFPHNINYHAEHHLFPYVPFYRLPALHRLLQQHSAVSRRIYVTGGIKGLLQDLNVSAKK
ncbi:MAG: fatty acid desaturase [Chitinophagales bacterium]|nr:MAG: fatty acid desaturase [Chitinophagales bacterium]